MGRLPRPPFSQPLPALVTPPPIDPKEREVLERRSVFLPRLAFGPLPGTAIGILVSDADRFTGMSEGRGGQRDAIDFSTDGNSYRYACLPALEAEKPEWSVLAIGVGRTEEAEVKLFHDLVLARAGNIESRGVTEPYALVRATINDGLGSPAWGTTRARQRTEHVVLSQIEVLDGTEAYPIRVADVVSDLQRRYEDHLGGMRGTIEEMMRGARARVFFKDPGKESPAKEVTLMYVTWMTEEERLQVRFRTRVEQVKFVPDRYRPPGADGRMHPLFDLIGDGTSTGVSLPPPGRVPRSGPQEEPKPHGYRLTIVVELGMSYDVTKSGSLEQSQALSVFPYWSY
jgi:hypothetical protein